MSFTDYIRETRAEMKHVSWPTRHQAISYTVIVIGISVITAAFLGVFDSLFTTLLRTFIVR